MWWFLWCEVHICYNHTFTIYDVICGDMCIFDLVIDIEDLFVSGSFVVHELYDIIGEKFNWELRSLIWLTVY